MVQSVWGVLEEARLLPSGEKVWDAGEPRQGRFFSSKKWIQRDKKSKALNVLVVGIKERKMVNFVSNVQYNPYS